MSPDFSLFNEIYHKKVLDRIAKKGGKKAELLYDILTDIHPVRKIFRFHFNKWLRFAKEKEGLDNDRLARLIGPDIFQWQRVVSEIEVAYFFAKAFGLEITFVTDAKNKGEGDFSIGHKEQGIRVEVKTPEEADAIFYGPPHKAWFGSGQPLPKRAFRAATHKQLQKGYVNLLVVYIQLRSKTRVPEAYKCFQNRPQNKRVSAVAHFRELNLAEQEQCFEFAITHNVNAMNPLKARLFPAVSEEPSIITVRDP